MSVKISFCLPVFNVREYINDCINSIESQCIKVNYEIICIDDFSSDGSYEYLCKLSEHNKHIRLYKNETNRGVSYTRNKAVQLSTGQYIWFVDPDDMLYPDVVNEFYNAAEREQADIVLGNYMNCPHGGGQFKKQTDYFFGRVAADGTSLPTNGKTRMCAVWAGLFKREFLVSSNILFRECMIAQEDTLFYYEWEQQVNKLLKTENVCYIYRQRSSSIMHIRTEKRSQAYYQSMLIMLQVYEEILDSGDYRDKNRLLSKIHHTKENIAVCLAMCINYDFVKEQMSYLKENDIYPYPFRLKALKKKNRRFIDFLMPVNIWFWSMHYIYAMVNKKRYKEKPDKT